MVGCFGNFSDLGRWFGIRIPMLEFDSLFMRGVYLSFRLTLVSSVLEKNQNLYDL